jgi:hypothetical protein
MKDKDADNLVELVYMGGGWIPCNERANEIAEQSSKGVIHSFVECTERDLKFHQCYFTLLNMVYEYLPSKFKRQVQKHDFYKWLKHLQGKYKVKYTFADGTQFVEYDSISFGNMSQIRFREYIKDQLPFLYENVIGAFFEGVIYDSIVATIEKDYERFMCKL